jgi:hypothetical protein
MKKEDSETTSSWWHAAAACLGLCFICLIWGGMAALNGFFPGRLIRRAYEGAKAAKISYDYSRMEYSIDLWSSNSFQRAGVTIHDRQRACSGYTLYTSGHVQGAILIDMDGKVVHQWKLPYDRIWDKTAEVKNPRPANQIFWFKAQLFPNGDLMAVVEGNGSTPWGQGIIRIDRDSRLVWKFLGNAHHDFTIGDDGRIYGLTHRIRTTPFPGLNLDVPCLEDFLVILSPDGKKLDEISMFEAIANSRFVARLNDYGFKTEFGEYLHCNAARIVTERMAGNFPFAKAGQVLISMPHFSSTLGLLDPTTRRLVWYASGSWRAQHDPDFLENGHILLFDNCNNPDEGGISRVIEFDPKNGAIAWSYHGTKDDPLVSARRSGAQRLPNGNTLITESDRGRLIEVTTDGDVVWEFVNPVKGGKHGELIPAVSNGERIAPESLDASFQACLEQRQAQPKGIP